MSGAAAPASAAPGGAERSGTPVYLALGDSVAAGVGAVPGQTGYPDVLATLLRNGYDPAADRAVPGASTDLDLIGLAQGGATTRTLIHDQLAPALRLIVERRADRDPSDDVEVVTVTIGGNDVFRSAVAACIATTDRTGCQAALDSSLAKVGPRLTVILGALVAAAGRDTEVVVTTYYDPIGSCFLSALNPAATQIADVGLEGGSVPGVVTRAAGLNDVIRGAAAATGAQVGELYGELDATQYVGGRDCLHPNAAGHAEIARILYDTLAR